MSGKRKRASALVNAGPSYGRREPAKPVLPMGKPYSKAARPGNYLENEDTASAGWKYQLSANCKKYNFRFDFVRILT